MKQTILITGASGKLGVLYCEYFLKNDCVVVAIVSNPESEKKLYKYLINDNLDSSKNLFILCSDLRSACYERDLLEFTNKKELKINCFLHAARSLDSLEVDNNYLTIPANFEKEYHLAVIVPYRIIMALNESRCHLLSSIVLISSIYGIVPFNPSLYKNDLSLMPIQYGLAKSAQIHLMKELAIRFAKNNIAVNAVSYGGVEGRADGDLNDRYTKLCPSGRMLQEKDIVGPVDFLFSDKSSGLTGHNLIVDGGWTVW